jgi:N12 class adenine-specific DNA methylase
VARLLFDVESPLVESLERITDSGEIEDGPFLKGRTLNKPSRPQIETTDDALAVTLDELGKLDLEYVAKLRGISQDQAVEELGDRIFQTPAGEWQTDDEYLSGDVVQKLEEARIAANLNPELQRNVEALLKVQPLPLTYDKIGVKLGAPWLKPETIAQFADEVLGERGLPVTYDKTTAHWHVEGAKSRYRRSNTDDYGTEQRSSVELLDALLNNRSIKVTRKVDKKDVVDANATTAAVEAAKKIEARFKTWLWEDSLRTADYVASYNRSYNNIAPRRFNGDHLTLPGLSAKFKPHPHVKRAVWRIIQTGNTYLAHAVGAGKTAEQIIGGQEQKRLGLIRKPMHVIPNHMLKQFSQEFMELYPAANIMVADEQAFHTGNRRRFLAQASLNDPDAIIITHSAFGKIDTSEQMRDTIIGQMTDELLDAIEDAKKGDAPRHLVSRIEKQVEQLTRRFEGKTNAGKDKLLTFDELAVDWLAIDEAHEFRKLDFATNRNAKGIDANGSARALDLFIKTQWLEKQNPGRNLVMASGTPVTNTMAELYTVMKFMDLKALERDSIAAFDAWANMFGEVVPGYERNAAGGYEIVERFAKFVNVPELMRRVRNFMDVLTSNELGDLVIRPKIEGGGPQNVVTPTSEELDTYMQGPLNDRLEKSRAWKPSKAQPANPDPVINIITDARLSAIDMRYINPGLPSDPESKLNQMITKIAEKHHEFGSLEYKNKDGTKAPRKGAAQIVFSPVGFGEQVAKNRGFDVRAWIDGELVRLGVKKSEIGWMSDANTHAKKEQLQKDVRSGKVRILIGSPKNMGTGLNVQDRLKVLHFLAPPWYPADVTQPHGRIERQGNQNTEAGIYWYATKGTYDSTGWGMVARKQKFIDDAMAGDDSVRTLEDISEANMFEMAAALAAGDDRVIRIAALGGEVERLQRLKGAHADQQRSLRSDINTYSDFELPRLEKHLAGFQAARELQGGYRPFSLTVNGATFEKHGEAGEALKVALAKAIETNAEADETEVAKLYGKFPVLVQPTRGGDAQLVVRVGPVDLKAGRAMDPASIEHLDNVGTSRSIEMAVQRIPSEISETQSEIAKAQNALEAAKRKYGAPFPEESQLNDAIAERNQLQGEMAAETKAAEDAKNVKASALVDDGTARTVTITPEQKQEMWREVAGIARQIMPNKNIRVSVFDTLATPNGRIQGFHRSTDNLIGIAADIQQSRQWVMAHETVHAMKTMGLFTPGEWKLLVRDSWTNNPELQAHVRGRWPSTMTEEQLQEEAIAENFGSYFDMSEASGWKGRLANRVLKFFMALVKAFNRVTGKGDSDAVEATRILELMRRGEIGARPVGFGEAPRTGGQAFSPAPPTQSESFKRWFGKSEVVDDGGKPLVVYHGTNVNAAELTSFKSELSEDSNDFGPGFYFTNNRADAEGYDYNREFGEPQVIPAYLKIENPYIIGVTPKLGSETGADFAKAVRAAGYDGIIDRTVNDKFQSEGYRPGEGTVHYVAFEPTQIKSVQNDGAFDPGNPDIRASVIDQPVPSSPEFGGDTENRWQEARKGIGDGPGVLESAKAWWEDLTGGFTRHWRALPNSERFADASQQLRKLEAAPHAALTEAVRHLKSLVGNMDVKEYDLFSRKVVLDDLSWDAGEGRDLPFGFTPTTLRAARANVDAMVGLSPKLVAAVRNRKAYVRAVSDRMVATGVLTREQVKNPAYFRHMVLDYARHEAALAHGPNKVKSPYWAKRMGSKLDINANILEAELDWLQKAQIDIATAETLEWVKNSPHNIRETLRAKGRAENAENLSKALESNPSARKEDGWFRSNIARGFQLVKDEIEEGNLDPIPPHLQGMARDIMTGERDAGPPFALMAWILDNDKAGSMGAAMVLKYTGLRKQWQRNLLGDKWVDTDDVGALVKHYKPEGYSTFQPRDGRHLFTAKTITESALDMFVNKLADTATPGLDREELTRALGSVRSQLVVGGERYTMVLPDELAATLEEFGDRRGEGMVARVFGGIQSAWKRWVLINPRRYLKYNLNNTTGDLDAVLAGKMSSIKRVPEAWRMLREASKGNPSARYIEALERGVFQSALSAQEIPDINRLSAFRHLAEKSNRPDKLALDGVGRLWRALQDSTNFRESLFRLAAYLQYADEIEAGVPQAKVGYGASLPKIVDAVEDPKDKAALLARDLLGDYGSISVAGSWLRRYLVPFWSWMEINTRRYWRLTGNAYTTGKARGVLTGGLLGASVGARTAIWLYVRMALLYAVLYSINHLLHPDEEKELTDEQAKQLHLILGRDSDGKVVTLRTQGALSDVLGELGFLDAGHAFHKWMNGQGSMGSIVTDMAKAPINRVATAVTPLLGEPVEQMLGEELWPDAFNPRVIHDKWRHLFQTVSLENEYDKAAGKPTRGYARSWTESLVYRRDPGEMAYDQARSTAYDWLEQKRGERGGSSSSPRGEALRDYRMALRYGDQDAAEKALRRYDELGGTKKSLKASIKQAHPLGPIAKKDRAEFVDSLTEEQLETLQMADRFWRETYANGK